MIEKRQVFVNFIKSVEQKGSISQAIAFGESNYCLKAYKITKITSQEAQQIYEYISHKFYNRNQEINSKSWFQNQLRLFVWFLICYIYFHECRIEDLMERDWIYFTRIFDRKDPQLFYYQCRVIYSVKSNKNWVRQQDQMLTKIVIQIPNRGKWSQISKLLYGLSAKAFFRTAKQCRQRWNNHLDPYKIKGNWSAQQCLALFQFVVKNGKKWASFAKLLKQTRNEHSIKNKFNSIIKKHKRLSETQDQHQMYFQIISRFKKTIENKLEDEKANESFQIQQINKLLNITEKQHQFSNSQSPPIQHFLKALNKYQTKHNQKWDKTTRLTNQHQYKVVTYEQSTSIDQHTKKQYRNLYDNKQVNIYTTFVRQDINSVDIPYSQFHTNLFNGFYQSKLYNYFYNFQARESNPSYYQHRVNKIQFNSYCQ